MRIVLEREAKKYKAFVYDFFWKVLRPARKYRELTDDQAELLEELWEGWFDLKEQHNIKEEE